jgi:hypothetical protein
MMPLCIHGIEDERLEILYILLTSPTRALTVRPLDDCSEIRRYIGWHDVYKGLCLGLAI